MDQFLLDRAKRLPFSPKETAEAFELDVEDVMGIIDDYFRAVKSDLRKLSSAVQTNCFEEMSTLSQKIKGSAGNLRIKFVSQVAKEIETAAKGRKQINFIDKYKTLEELVTIAQNQFKGVA